MPKLSGSAFLPLPHTLVHAVHAAVWGGGQQGRPMSRRCPRRPCHVPAASAQRHLCQRLPPGVRGKVGQRTFWPLLLNPPVAQGRPIKRQGRARTGTQGAAAYQAQHFAVRCG